MALYGLWRNALFGESRTKPEFHAEKFAVSVNKYHTIPYHTTATGLGYIHVPCQAFLISIFLQSLRQTANFSLPLYFQSIKEATRETNKYTWSPEAAARSQYSALDSVTGCLCRYKGKGNSFSETLRSYMKCYTSHATESK